MNLTRENVAWAAGFFDGEGHVIRYALANKKQYPMFGIGLDQNDPELLNRFIDIFGVGKVVARKNRKCHNLRYTSFETAQFIAATLWPWLSVKRKKEISETLARVGDHRRRTDIHEGRSPQGRLIHKDNCKNNHAYADHGVIDGRGYWKCLECIRVRSN